MLSDTGFDLWADGYDRDVGLSDDDGSYPFAGYREVLNRIYNRVLTVPGARVLDLGFGTGVLAARLEAAGCEIWGQDFSARMIELARPRLPRAHLYQGDFAQAIAAPVLENRYDFIIATYSIHHLDLDGKVKLLRQLQGLLAPKGRILIGDVAFEDAPAQERCRRSAGDDWDDEERYCVYDELRSFFPGMTFEAVSHCAGILTLTRP